MDLKRVIMAFESSWHHTHFMLLPVFRAKSEQISIPAAQQQPFRVGRCDFALRRFRLLLDSQSQVEVLQLYRSCLHLVFVLELQFLGPFDSVWLRHLTFTLVEWLLAVPQLLSVDSRLLLAIRSQAPPCQASMPLLTQ
jgi:hypothetical protein